MQNFRKILEFPSIRTAIASGNAKNVLRPFAVTASKVSEQDLKDLLLARFVQAKEIVVEDVSGGCGAMFNVFVQSDEFKGLSIVKQHKAITETLKEQIKLIHGLRIETKTVT